MEPYLALFERFISHFVDLVGHVVWPTFFLNVALVFRKQISSSISYLLQSLAIRLKEVKVKHFKATFIETIPKEEKFENTKLAEVGETEPKKDLLEMIRVTGGFATVTLSAVAILYESGIKDENGLMWSAMAEEYMKSTVEITKKAPENVNTKRLIELYKHCEGILNEMPEFKEELNKRKRLRPDLF